VSTNRTCYPFLFACVLHKEHDLSNRRFKKEMPHTSAVQAGGAFGKHTAVDKEKEYEGSVNTTGMN